MFCIIYSLKKNNTYPDLIISQKGIPPFLIFCGLWLLLFLIYLPAARAGFVTDFVYWLESVQCTPFDKWVNRSEVTDIHSLYQFRQLMTYLFYLLMGTHAWLWHFLFITLQATVAFLLYTLIARVLNDMSVSNGGRISLAGVLLFCTSPYISEVTIWKACDHYMLGVMIILLILIWVQRYVHTMNKKYAVGAMIVYFLSTYSLEIFYLTPLLVLAFAMFYRYNPAFDKKIFRKVIFWFFLPELFLFLLSLSIFRIAYGKWLAHAYDKEALVFGFSEWGKPARYFFHLIFMGRFFPETVKQQVYDFCGIVPFVVIFWGLIISVLCYIMLRFQKLSGKGKVAGLLYVWMLITLVLLVRMGFNGMMLVSCDRYVYCTALFFYILVAVLLSFITSKFIRVGVYSLFALMNLCCAIQVSRYWGQSHHVLYGLLHNIPATDNKKIILLNVPETMHGVPMIHAQPNSETKLMQNVLMRDKAITQTVFDCMGYNMLSPEDGAHVRVLSDDKIRVTLNQFGTWWWYNGQGALAYKNEDYAIYMVDVGHTYDLTFKKPANNYLLLYSVGDKWKTVDMSKKDVDQN